ncbi:MAG TPA: DNA/RNA non-specific endonuclease [Bacteroidales bacterium]|nr:DNA/RNA non-specific endonuclease [Bacteroidales bacterium]HXK81451.1 DNA/RNA non-specific endonuclease [Bacteroidales bacterium]
MKVFTVLLFVLCSTFLLSQENEIKKAENEYRVIKQQLDSLEIVLEDLKLAKIRNDLKEYGLPSVSDNEELIWHSSMVLVYDEQHEIAKWVAHILLSDVTRGSVSRTNDFRPDSLVKTGSTIEEDYFLKHLQADSTYKYDGYGYDRGHLAPSADFRWSERALSESYLYSNIAPQLPEFNRNKWADIENFVRAYMYRYPKSQLFVVTGPVLNDELPKLERSPNRVSIPEQYYKVIMDFEAKRGMAFLVPHKNLIYPPEYYAITIDSLEEITGINFFHTLSNEDESKIEAKINIEAWLPKSSKNDKTPIKEKDLPKNAWNTVEAGLFVDKNEKITVCGTVVSTHKSNKGNVFLNLDKSFPNQIFSVTIWNRDLINFSYQPEIFLLNKKICVTGTISSYQGVPGTYVNNEKRLEIIE